MFAENAKNEMLDALSVDRIKLHSGDPGEEGTDNEASELVAATFAPAEVGERVLAATINFTGLAPSTPVTWFSVWSSYGLVYKAKGQITEGDAAANSLGEYQLTTETKLQLVDEV